MAGPGEDWLVGQVKGSEPVLQPEHHAHTTPGPAAGISAGHRFSDGGIRGTHRSQILGDRASQPANWAATAGAREARASSCLNHKSGMTFSWRQQLSFAVQRSLSWCRYPAGPVAPDSSVRFARSRAGSTWPPACGHARCRMQAPRPRQARCPAS